MTRTPAHRHHHARLNQPLGSGHEVWRIFDVVRGETRLSFDSGIGGMRAHNFSRWVSTSGAAGPYDDTASAMVAASESGTRNQVEGWSVVTLRPRAVQPQYIPVPHPTTNATAIGIPAGRTTVQSNTLTGASFQLKYTWLMMRIAGAATTASRTFSAGVIGRYFAGLMLLMQDPRNPAKVTDSAALTFLTLTTKPSFHAEFKACEGGEPLPPWPVGRTPPRRRGDMIGIHDGEGGGVRPRRGEETGKALSGSDAIPRLALPHDQDAPFSTSQCGECAPVAITIAGDFRRPILRVCRSLAAAMRARVPTPDTPMHKRETGPRGHHDVGASRQSRAYPQTAQPCYVVLRRARHGDAIEDARRRRGREIVVVDVL